ncbi:MAG: amidase family protein [Desulfobaccales bacterium]
MDDHMPRLRKSSLQESGAFVEVVKLPPTARGPLDGLRFAVKDIIDLAGRRTSCGSPDWAKTHPPAAANAVCVDQLLGAGAQGIGKAISDELAFSLDGDNYFYGAPLNPRAPDHVTGGSSSGSASAVACGLADFALGTDTGGSIRVPAANCGIFGLRPSHGFISLAGVTPVAPGFDTVGLLAASADLLTRAGAVLLAAPIPGDLEVGAVHLIREAWDISDQEIRAALGPAKQVLQSLFGGKVRETSLTEIAAEAGSGLSSWYETSSILQWCEIWNSWGSWVESAKPALSPKAGKFFDLIKNADRGRLGDAIRTRERYFRRLENFLGPRDLICFPTVPAPARLKGGLKVERPDKPKTNYSLRTLSLTAIAGIGRLPEVSLPLAEVGGVPVGLSLLAGHGRDAYLLGVVELVAARSGLSG